MQKQTLSCLLLYHVSEVQVRKVQLYQPPRALNKGNIAHYSIVQQDTEIKVQFKLYHRF